MGQRNTETDVEALQKGGRRRGRCLDVFLVVAITFLFAAVAAVAVVLAKVVLERPHQPYKFGSSRQTDATSSTTYKTQNFVYLEAIETELKTSTMRFTSVNYGEMTSLGSNFDFNKDKNSLVPKAFGTYFIYINLNLTCTYKCGAGVLSVHVGEALTCKVDLKPVADETVMSKKCWTVSQIQGDELFTQMTVPKEGLKNWRLEKIGSGLGMFLVD